MSDTLSAARSDNPSAPIGGQRPPDRVIEIQPAGNAAIIPTGIGALTTNDAAPRPEAGLDQLSRIEDKTARIEEKYARSEARMQRVVDKVDAAMDRFGNVAMQSDLAAVRAELGLIGRRVKRIPGFGAMLATSVVTAILTAAVIIALFRYGGAYLTPPR